MIRSLDEVPGFHAAIDNPTELVTNLLNKDSVETRTSLVKPAGFNIRGRAIAARRLACAEAGFTLAEIMIATLVIALLTAACLLAVGFDQVAIRKAKEEAIVMDFLTHYAENVKALPFAMVVSGYPINSLYNGQGGAPRISIPPPNEWVAVDTNAFQIFDPDLLWLTGRHPQMQVALTTNVVAGVLHDVDVNLKLDWDSPLGRGGRLEVQLDLLRTKDVPTL